MKTTKKNNQANISKPIDQSTINQKVKELLGDNIDLNLIQKIIQTEQSVCLDLLSKGRKIVKWNYLTMFPSLYAGRKLTCPKNGVTYNVPPTMRLTVRVGAALRKAVQNNVSLPQNSSPVDNKPAKNKRKNGGKQKLYADRFIATCPQSDHDTQRV